MPDESERFFEKNKIFEPHIWLMLNKELRAIGREPWPMRAFDLIWQKVLDEICDRDERLEERQGDKITLTRAGKRATELTERVEMI